MRTNQLFGRFCHQSSVMLSRPPNRPSTSITKIPQTIRMMISGGRTDKYSRRERSHHVVTSLVETKECSLEAEQISGREAG